MEIVIGKSDSLVEPGYVYAPYIPINTTPQVVWYNYKNLDRKKKINKVFNLGLDIKDEFSPSKSILSRYSTKTINIKYYGTFVVNNQA